MSELSKALWLLALFAVGFVALARLAHHPAAPQQMTGSAVLTSRAQLLTDYWHIRRASVHRGYPPPLSLAALVADEDRKSGLGDESTLAADSAHVEGEVVVDRGSTAETLTLWLYRAGHLWRLRALGGGQPRITEHAIGSASPAQTKTTPAHARTGPAL